MAMLKFLLTLFASIFTEKDHFAHIYSYIYHKLYIKKKFTSVDISVE